MKEKQVYKKIWPLPVKKFKKIFLWHQVVHIMYVDRQGCVIKTVAYSLRTDTHTDTQTHRRTGTWTDKSLKTEGPKFLSIHFVFLFLILIDFSIAIFAADLYVHSTWVSQRLTQSGQIIQKYQTNWKMWLRMSQLNYLKRKSYQKVIKTKFLQ